MIVEFFKCSCGDVDDESTLPPLLINPNPGVHDLRHVPYLASNVLWMQSDWAMSLTISVCFGAWDSGVVSKLKRRRTVCVSCKCESVRDVGDFLNQRVSKGYVSTRTLLEATSPDPKIQDRSGAWDRSGDLHRVACVLKILQPRHGRRGTWPRRVELLPRDRKNSCRASGAHSSTRPGTLIVAETMERIKCNERQPPEPSEKSLELR